MLKLLQVELPKLWTDEFYNEQFRRSPCPYKDFDHALKHVDKARAFLSMMVEEADHVDLKEPFFPKEQVEKYLADIIISAVRLASTNPSGQIDLEMAVRERIEKKMGAKLARPNSRQIAEEIFRDSIKPCYDGMGQDNEPEPEDREAMLQGIEAVLEQRAGVDPDAELTKAREENEARG